MGTPFKRSPFGFTIVELLIVIVVIAVLAAIVTVAYNGISSRASDAAAKSNIETMAKKLEVDKINNQKYPLTLAEISGGGITAAGDVRMEYTSDTSSYCVTTSSVRAKADYYKNDTTGSFVSGKCPNHLGYQGGAGTFSTSSIFGSSPPTGSYQAYNDGGGNLSIGDRFYTTRENGIRIVGARFWEPVNAPAAFLNTPLTVRVNTQDWKGSSLGGWDALGTPEISATFSGVRKAGTWTYVMFSSSVSIAKATPASGPKDTVTIAGRYDGNYYVAPTPAMPDAYTESNQLSGVYLSEDGIVGRSVSTIYPSNSSAFYYGIDILFTAL